MKRLILLFSMLLSILSLTTQAQRIILLPEIEFEAPAVIVNNDTLTYNVSVISSSKDKSLEDLLRKLPGIEISGSGRITYDGKPISHSDWLAFSLSPPVCLHQKYTIIN